MFIVICQMNKENMRGSNFRSLRFACNFSRSLQEKNLVRSRSLPFAVAFASRSMLKTMSVVVVEVALRLG